ncbi:MAG: bifunctional glutamate N-acetyltransferase/amino-acid acetyltransferase ArgJ [Chloroflexi bacterium]|nr:bifunctional glutamate N-acetyltransferase/amino-acid acetyltransferase ArgJ [Chloroflexota bacterium]
MSIMRIEDGTIASPKGFLAGGVFCGVKAYGEEKMDLGLLYSEEPSAVAAVFTKNTITAPAILVSREHLRDRKAQAVVVNSGIANVAVGEQGRKDAQTMTELAAQKLGLRPQDVLVASTGVIGVELPMARIKTGIDEIQLSRDGGHDMARAILTTDTHTKEIAVSFDAGDGTQAIIGGIAKGAGMIHPDMATMLSFLATDAAVEAGFLQQSLEEAADLTYNMISVDGDTSTSDTVALMANGMAGNRLIEAGGPGAQPFREALMQVADFLAKQIARDGEGATKLIEIRVEKARTREDARQAARIISTSMLVKSAIHGNDPNWGRIMAVLGRTGIEIIESKIDLFINDMFLLNDGVPVPFYPDAVSRSLDQEEVTIKVVLNLGDASATAWTCDLSEEYVTFNSEYTT